MICKKIRISRIEQEIIKASPFSEPGIPPTLIPSRPVKKPIGEKIEVITESTYIFLFKRSAKIVECRGTLKQELRRGFCLKLFFFILAYMVHLYFPVG